MNITNLNTTDKANEGVKMELIDPRTDEPMAKTEVAVADGGEAITITVLGVDSTEFEKIEKEFSSKVLKSLKKKGGSQSVRAEDTERAIRLTKTWDGIGDETGDLECNYKNKKRIYTGCPWIRDQVMRFAGEQANYFRGTD